MKLLLQLLELARDFPMISLAQLRIFNSVYTSKHFYIPD